MQRIDPLQREIVARAPNESLLDGITILDLIKVAKRVLRFLRTWWLYPVAAALALAVLGGVGGLLMPTNHKATFTVRLVPKVSDNPVAAFTRSNVEFFTAPDQNFRAEPLLRQTCKAMGIDADDWKTFNDVSGRLGFWQVGHNTYEGVFTDASAEAAQKFLETHMANYRDSEIAKTIGTIQAEMNFLTDRLKQVESELNASETALQEFQEKHADGLPEQAELHYNSLRGLQGKKIELQAELEQVSLELKLNREKLAGEKLFVESKVISTQRKTPYEDQLVVLKADLAKLRAAGLNGAHPRVKQTENLIATYAKLAEEEKVPETTETEKSRNPVFQSIQDTIYQLEVREKVAQNSFTQVESNLARVAEIVDRLPALQRTYAELTRNYETTADLQRRIFNQYKVTELQLALEKQAAASRFDIIAPPHVIYSTPMKRAIMMGVLGAVAGVALGLLAAGVFEVMRYVRARS